ncbi:MAG: HEAT repeat domain-containing protein [Myxococcales bacterium]|nr:HEAT repeat domain-containing protein [Myxococcales bacterium]
MIERAEHPQPIAAEGARRRQREGEPADQIVEHHIAVPHLDRQLPRGDQRGRVLRILPPGGLEALLVRRLEEQRATAPEAHEHLGRVRRLTNGDQAFELAGEVEREEGGEVAFGEARPARSVPRAPVALERGDLGRHDADSHRATVATRAVVEKSPPSPYADAVSSRGSARALLAPLLLAATVALADKVDDLARALLTDPSFRVKVQAALILGKLKDPRCKGPLVEALKDDNEAVRVVAAGSLAKLGDRGAIDALRTAMDDSSMAVRGAAGKAIAALEKGPAATGRGATAGGKIFLALAPFNSGKGTEEAAKRVQEKVVGKLADLPNITLDPAAAAGQRYYVDASITNLSSTPPDGEGHVRIDCDIKVVVATYPERSIKMMASVGGSLEGTNDAKDIASAKDFCLADASKQFVSKIQTFLETPR